MPLSSEQAALSTSENHGPSSATDPQRKRRLSPMRPMAATVFLVCAALGWYFGLLPPFLALVVATSLTIWGLNLDWRRTQRLADLDVEGAAR